MKIDGNIGNNLHDVPAQAKDVEAAGYAGAWVAEMAHDPFLPLLLAAEHTENLEIGTSIAVAFSRSPMTVANTAWDLQAYSKGRFVLGLGSQIKPHIEKRFSMEWSKPAARMREFALAMRAIWNTWLTGEKLEFRGEFYRHTLMTPMFSPDKRELDGEAFDGFICHGFTTEKYLREVTIPALARGREKAGKTMEGFEIVGPSFVITGNNDEEIEKAAIATRKQIAFYGSTPAYRPVLDMHGWGGLQDELNTLSKQGEWDKMGTLIDDEILNTFAVVGEPETIAGELGARYGDVIQRLSFYAPYASDPDRWSKVMADLREV